MFLASRGIAPGKQTKAPLDGAIHYKLYILKLTMAVDNIVFRIIKGAF